MSTEQLQLHAPPSGRSPTRWASCPAAHFDSCAPRLRSHCLSLKRDHGGESMERMASVGVEAQQVVEDDADGVDRSGLDQKYLLRCGKTYTDDGLM